MAKKPHRTDEDDTADQSDLGPDDAPQGDATSPPPAPTQAELDADKQPLDPAEAEQLMRAGHRLRVKGQPPSEWICMTRHSGDLAISFAATDDKIKDVVAQELLLADD
jgi:hypothetical protein